MKNVLITRPQNRAQEVAKVFEDKGFKVFIEPLFSVQKIDVGKIILPQVSAVIIASVNACEAIVNSDLPKNIKIFVVGKKTAQHLRESGFGNIILAPENSANSLKDLILETQDQAGSILNLHGSIISLDFKSELEKSAFKVQNILCYQTHEVKNLSSQFLQFSQNNYFDQVLIFSQNSAKIFFKLATKHNLLEYFKSSQLLCLSEKILHDVKNFGFTNSTTFKESPILKNFYD